MNQKEALTALMLGLKIRRKRWHIKCYINIKDNSIIMNYQDGSYSRNRIDDFITQDHHDWEICPQGNEQNPEGDGNVNNTACTKAR